MRRELRGVEMFDPQTLSGLPSMAVIANTEREWLDKTDFMLFYFEENNPSGLGSAFEVGYAVARGIPVVFVDEKRTSHTEWLGIHCTYVTDNLKDGIEALRREIAQKTRDRYPTDSRSIDV